MYVLNEIKHNISIQYHGNYNWSEKYLITCSVQQPLAPLQVASKFGKEQQLGKNKTETCPVRLVMCWAGSSQCKLPLFNRVAGQVEVQVNLGAACPAWQVPVMFSNPCCTLICLNYTFLEVSQKYFGCPEGWSLRVWVSKWYQTPCSLRLCRPLLSEKRFYLADN